MSHKLATAFKRGLNMSW